MNEIKRPKTPLIFYYLIVLLIIMLVNALVMPKIAEHAVQEVDYGTFMSMTENGEIGKVQLQSNQILFTNKDETTVYKTGLMNDPGLVERLYASGAEFTSEIIEQASPLVTLLFSWLLPIIIFVVLGQFLSKKMMDKAGGGPGSLMFNMGKSNAKIYVKSSDGIRFSDVEGVDEAEENLQEIVDYLHNPQKYQEIGASTLREPAKPCSQRPWPVKLMFRFSRYPVRNSSKCLSAWVRPKSVICSDKPRRKPPASCL